MVRANSTALNSAAASANEGVHAQNRQSRTLFYRDTTPSPPKKRFRPAPPAAVHCTLRLWKRPESTW